MAPSVAMAAVTQTAEEYFTPLYVHKKKHSIAHAETYRVEGEKDRYQKVANPAKTIYDFYKAHNNTFDAAASALVTINGFSLLQKGSGDFIEPLKKIVEGLDTLSNVHPFVKVGVLAFNAVVMIEIKRRENNKRAMAVVLQMADMMGTLFQLRDIKDPDLKTDTGGSIAGRLQVLMSGIKEDIQTCGAIIDTYQKSNAVAKFVKAPNWEDKLKSAIQHLADRKAEITYALAIHTAIGVNTVISQLNEFQRIITSKSPEEIKLEKELERLGGREACLDDPDKRAKLIKLFPGESDTTTLSPGRDLKCADLGSRSAKKAAWDHELSAPIDTLIAENRSLYERALEASTEQILDSVNRGATLILQNLNAGPHERLRHPVMRNLWKDMKWRPSVKARTFVLGLLDFYIDQHIAATLHNHHVEQSSLVSVDALPGTLDVSPAVASNSLQSSAELQYDVQMGWCMQYLTVSHVPVLVEAFDEDGSGWIKITEVNDFTAGIPSGWKLIEYLAYRSSGWELETMIYCRRILALFHELGTISTRVLPENIQSYNAYINHWSFCRIFGLVSLPAKWHWKVAKAEGLFKLVSSRLEASIAKWEGLLRKGKYEIDSVDAITHISGGRGIDFFYPIVYVLLRHHVRIARVAETKVLDEREMLVAEDSLAYVIGAAWERKKILENLFRQQRHESSTRLKNYAGGFFDHLGGPEAACPDPIVDPIPTYPEYEAEVVHLHSLSALPLDLLKYSTGRLDDSGYRERWEEPALSTFKRKDVPIQYTGRRRIRALWRIVIDAVRTQVRAILKRRTWGFIMGRRDLRWEFLELDYKWKKHNLHSKHRGSHHGGIDEALTEAQDRRLVEIEHSISHRDYDFYWSMTNVMLSRRFCHADVRCSGCWMTPYGMRYTCVQCSGFDYCEHCYMDPAKKLRHHDIHHRFDHDMIKIPRPLPRGLVELYKKRAHNELKHRADCASDDVKTMRKQRRKRDHRDHMHHLGLALSMQNDGQREDESEDEEENNTGSDPDEEDLECISPDSGINTNGPEFLATTRTASPSEMTCEDSTATESLWDIEHTDQNASLSQPHVPIKRRTFTCKGGCGRGDLILHYLCLDCKNDYVLCPECDDVFTRSIHNADTDGGHRLSFFLQCHDHSDDAQHNPRHVILIIKELDRKISEVEGKKDADVANLFSQLRADFMTRTTSLEQKVDRMETILIALPDRLEVSW